MNWRDLAFVIPAVNLFVLLVSGMYGLTLLNKSVAEGMKIINLILETSQKHTTCIASMETRLKDQSSEIERLRDRLDRFLEGK